MQFGTIGIGYEYGKQVLNCKSFTSTTNKIIMNTFSRSNIIVISGFMLLMSAGLFSQADAQNRSRSSGAVAESVQKPDSQSQETTQRGIFQPRENRLVLQLDDLTEEQLERIDELNAKHRDKVMELRAKMRNNEITREAFRNERRAHYEKHQNELEKVLTKEQWEQLQELRAERRRSPGN
ncbi:MAG: hypothetical protein EA363_09005 [Balneolaceae bacterium]|nr:MAG: hypothetical protein EA363_09005 [Balneolaceae bacterium]